MTGAARLRGLASVDDLSRADVLALLDRADELATAGDGARTRPGRIVGLLFGEASTRTRVSFATAAARLGAVPIDVGSVRDAPGTSAPETLEDTLRVVGAWCDMLVVRWPDAEAWRRAAAVAPCPVVCGGAGRTEHPTQALLDLAALRRRFGDPTGLRVGLVGDLAGSRSACSVVRLLRAFPPAELRLLAPPCRQPDGAWYAGHATVVRRADRLDLAGLDVVYMAGLPPGSGAAHLDAAARRQWALTADRQAELPDHALVLCPLPRIDEIDAAVDADPRAGYFAASAHGVWVRAAVVEWVLERGGPG